MLHSRLRPFRLGPTTPLSPTSSASEPERTPSNHSEVDSSDESPEDLFASFIQIPHLFPDDVPNFHGDPGQHLVYSSPRYGDLRIMVPSYPDQAKESAEASSLPPDAEEASDVEKSRKLCAHFIWSAAMVVSEGIERADLEDSADAHGAGDSDAKSSNTWSVRGENVLELGAGAGLPSITAALAKASRVTITDHPISAGLGPSGAIALNVKYNIPQTNTACAIEIRPHEWGTTLTSDPWALSSKGQYTRIIAADCYWMRSQHENLVRTMKWFLAPTGKIWVVAGFHTGRPIVAGFFETAVEMGLEIESIYERDLNSSVEEGGEIRREWFSEREGEGPENRKRWCVVAVLRHAASDSPSTAA